MIKAFGVTHGPYVTTGSQEFSVLRLTIWPRAKCDTFVIRMHRLTAKSPSQELQLEVGHVNNIFGDSLEGEVLIFRPKDVKGF
jgi:hypothetical protein